MGMSWQDVGGWLKNNAGSGAALIGSMLTGNIPGAIAAGVSLVSGATGEADPDKVLTALQTDPTTVLRLRELALQDAASIREHIRAIEELRLKDAQAEHEQTQLTIRGGDGAGDEYVRHTRPLMARQSWYATMAYVIVFEGLKALHVFSGGAVLELAMLLVAPAGAYIGFRTLDKRAAFSASK